MRTVRFVGMALLLFAARTSAQEQVDFARDVQPILQQHCVSCHGPSQQIAGLRLDRRRDALRGGTMGVVIGPGNADGSRLYMKVSGTQFGPQMPPAGALAPEEIRTIKNWIDQGAPWPDAVAGEEPLPTPDPRATRLMDALRNANVDLFRAEVARDPGAAALKGAGGSTPLMFAALYGSVSDMRQLLDCGADPNVRNDAGATALMWAAGDIDKVRLLLERRAEINVRSQDGRTPLMIAASRFGSTPVLALLLERGANPNVKAGSLFGPATPLSEAAYAGDVSAIKLLLRSGADPKVAGFLPVALAVQSGCLECLDVLARTVDTAALNSALAFSMPPFGDGSRTHWLIERGASIPTPRGAGRANANGGGSSSAAPAAAMVPAVVPVASHATSPREAVARSLPLLQRTGETFLQKSGCVSCHNNTLTAMTVAAARTSGIAVDEEMARSQKARIAAFTETWRDRVLQGIGVPGDADTISYILHGLAAEQHPPDAATDAMAYYLKNRQMQDGRWRILAHRPPIESSDIEVTATSMRALQVYAPAARRAEYDEAIARAAAWLVAATPRNTEERAFRLLGLAWSGAAREIIQEAARDLVAQQRDDGGWAQLTTLESDAYATGQALVALHESGALSAGDGPYRRGVRFLLDSQYADGSWLVKTRAVPIQPLFEIGFPHGRDAWISAAATNWASTALAYAARTPQVTRSRATASGR
jgi:cytochrome c551/c552